MKCLMVRQPWASQIANGSKTVEIRSWHYAHRGDLLIGASKNMAGQRMADGTPYPSGMAIAHVKLVDCVPFNAKQHGKAAGCDRDTAQDCEDSGDWAWIFADARAIEPFPVKGQVKPFEVDYDERGRMQYTPTESPRRGVLHTPSLVTPTNLVNVTYAQTSASINTNPQGMRDMQARAFAARDAQYLLLKAPPASGKSRALMFLGLDKLYNQGVKKVIVAVPERSIGSSFSSTKLSEHGFFADWELNDDYNLCTPGGETSKVKAFQQFLDDNAATLLICTHATLRFAFEGLETSRLNNTLLAIDEFHHVSADVDNRLGEVLRAIMNTTTAHIIAMTGSYFRGDSVPVLQPDDEARFTKVTYNYYEQLNGYTHLKTLGIGYHFYQGRYLTAIGEILDTDKKTILHIPNVNAGESTKDKRNEVDRILDIIGRVTHQDATTGVIFVERTDGKIIKVADLVNDTPKDRDKIVAYLRDINSAADMDLIIALGMAKEGFDWPFCEHALTVGYRGSLTEIIQIIGRATRDSQGKPHAQFTNLIAQPDAADAQVKLSVNNMLKAITASLLMEQVLAPNFTFKTKRFDDEEDTPPGTIKIRGFKEPSSRRVKDIVESDLNDLKAAILQDSTLLKVLPGEFVEPEVINKVLIPKVIRLKYPDLTDAQVEEVRQHVVADSAIKNGEIKTVGDKQFVRMAGKFVNIEELHIDLIDRINPFQKAFEVLSKSVTSKLLKVIQETIDAGRIAMTDEEAVILYRDKIGVFLKTHGREPAINAPDPLEKRMAEALVYLRNKRRQQQAAATPATETPA
ncbi:ASCH domain-containing protein [Thiothrix lacustris]|uniref:ASCH domain-containing protein n=2 Tax=Thiothrix TaxID=1030 RepID=A0ABY9MRG8_9GAMM|nr:ASCH domain-containing protein [Thiothrix lacustris]WML90780.1 ASCH domain-containing protein [Thiothrix lacustris]